MAVQVYLFAREWMIPHLMEAVEDYVGKNRPEDALKILGHFVGEENNISASCLEVRKYIIFLIRQKCKGCADE
jgi:hypothetical protein